MSYGLDEKTKQDILAKGIDQTAELSKETLESADTLYNAFFGRKYDIALGTIEEQEENLLTAMKRTLEWGYRKSFGQLHEKSPVLLGIESVASSVPKATDAIGKDIKGVALYGEKEVKDALETTIDSGRDVALYEEKVSKNGGIC